MVASKTSLRRNSQSAPWNRLVPERVMMLVVEPRLLSELGAGVMSQNPELGDGIHRRPENESAIHAVEIVGSINQKIVRFRPLAIDRIGLAGTQRSSRCLPNPG